MLSAWFVLNPRLAVSILKQDIQVSEPLVSKEIIYRI